jgi:Fe2+ or Zn2+ uptake regulation protein
MLTRTRTKEATCTPPPLPYVKLLEAIKKPRRGLLTRFEFAVLSVLEESRVELDQTEILKLMQEKVPGSKPGTHTYRQLLELERMGCVQRRVPEDRTMAIYSVTPKGSRVLRKAAHLLVALTS